MTFWHNTPVLKRPAPAKLAQFVLEWQKPCARGTLNFEQFERELHALVPTVERECAEARLARYGLDVGEYETFELSGLDRADTKGWPIPKAPYSRDAVETLSAIIREISRNNLAPAELYPRALVSTRTEASE